MKRQPTRLRLYSHMTRRHFLHIEDSLNIGKLRLFAGQYQRGQGLAQHTHHFLDLGDARVICRALLSAEDGFRYREYKGSPARGQAADAVSRVLSVAIKRDRVYIELKRGCGQETATGAIQPAGKPLVAINIGLKRHEACRLAAEVLAYLQAWDLYRLLTHQAQVVQPPPYPVSPAASAGEATTGKRTRFGQGQIVPPPADRKPQNGQVQGAAPHPAAASAGTANGRSSLRSQQQTAGPASPLTDKEAATSTTPPAEVDALAQALYGLAESEQEVAPKPLRYGDGTAVDPANRLEQQTFRQYERARQRPPNNKQALITYYRQQNGTEDGV